MTPEERFTKIENFLLTVADNQADHDERFRRIEDWMTRQEEQTGRLLEGQGVLTVALLRITEAQERLTETQERLADAQGRTEEAQRQTEEKLHALIDTVDRIIRQNPRRKKPRRKTSE
jgi:hypothetical protein